jgi:hypothetical protein
MKRPVPLNAGNILLTVEILAAGEKLCSVELVG